MKLYRSLLLIIIIKTSFIFLSLDTVFTVVKVILSVSCNKIN